MNFLENDNKTLCPLPWMHIASHTDGSVRLCCVSDEYIKKEDGSRYNLGYDNLEDIFNSAHYKQIRQDMINGEKISGCSGCYNIEENNGISNRIRYYDKWINDSVFRKKYKQSLDNQNVDVSIQYFDLRYGNLCNLSCRSCYSESSSQYNKDIIEIYESSNIRKFQHINYKDLNDWYSTQRFIKNIQSQLNNITDFYCTGGEPTLIEENYRTLEMMIESGNSKNITLKFNTNLTNTKKDFYSLFKYFKHVNFLASIDGYQSMQEYLRHPSKWSQISNNFEKIVKLDSDNIHIVVNPVIQKTNLGNIVDLFEYCEQFNRLYEKAIVEIVPIITSSPSYLDVDFLPVDYKITCWTKIENWIKDKCKYQTNMFNHSMTLLKNRCHLNIEYKENLKNFFEYNDIWDQYRNQSLASVNKELAELR